MKYKCKKCDFETSDKTEFLEHQEEHKDEDPDDEMEF